MRRVGEVVLPGGATGIDEHADVPNAEPGTPAEIMIRMYLRLRYLKKQTPVGLLVAQFRSRGRAVRVDRQAAATRDV